MGGDINTLKPEEFGLVKILLNFLEGLFKPRYHGYTINIRNLSKFDTIFVSISK